MLTSRFSPCAVLLCSAALLATPFQAAAHGASHGLTMSPHAAVPSVGTTSPVKSAGTASTANGCGDAAACSVQALTATQSNPTALSQMTVPPQPYPAAAPAAPPVITAPSASTLMPDVAVDSSSGGTSLNNPGAAGLTLADCMAVWEPALHMSKGEWRQTCARTLNGVELPPDTTTARVDGSGTKHAHHRKGNPPATSAMAHN